jgi:hypothetical protein
MAYRIQRTGQFLGGHELDADDDIRRLSLWTILTTRWPCLAEDLVRDPDRFDTLCNRNGAPPEGVDEDLAAAYQLADARRFCSRAADLKLDSKAIQRFTST